MVFSPRLLCKGKWEICHSHTSAQGEPRADRVSLGNRLWLPTGNGTKSCPRCMTPLFDLALLHHIPSWVGVSQNRTSRAWFLFPPLEQHPCVSVRLVHQSMKWCFSNLTELFLSLGWAAWDQDWKLVLGHLWQITSVWSALIDLIRCLNHHDSSRDFVKTNYLFTPTSSDVERKG